MPIQLPKEDNVDEVKKTPSGEILYQEDRNDARREEVARLYLKGYTFGKIAERMKVSYGTIVKDMDRIRKQWKDNALKDFTTRMANELAKLDHVEWMAWQAYERTLQPMESTHTKTEYIRKPEELKNKGKNDNEDVFELDEDTSKRRNKRRDFGKGKDRPAHRDDRRGGTVSAKAVLTEKKYKGLLPIRMIEELKRVGQAGDPKYLEIVMKCIEMRSKICGLFKSEDMDKPTQVVVIPWNEIMKGQIPQNNTMKGSKVPLIEVNPDYADKNGSSDPYEQNRISDRSAQKQLENEVLEEEDEIEKMIENAGIEEDE